MIVEDPPALLTDDDVERSVADPEALIEEARRRHRQRLRRRKVLLGAAVVLAFLGFGIDQLVRGGGGLHAASPSSPPVESRSSGLIAFSRVVGGTSHVMVVDAAGRDEARDLGVGIGPRWSPDGKRLVFMDAIGRGPLRLFVMDADGTDRHPLSIPAPGSPHGDRAPAWSPDGSRIAFTRTVWPPGTDPTARTTTVGRTAIYVFQLDHGGLTQVTPAAEADELPAFLTWSPDGKRLAYVSGTGRSYVAGGFGLGCTGLYVIDVDGTGNHLLSAASRSSEAPDACVPIWSPSWSPDGKWIAFGRSSKAFTGGVDLYLISPDGSQLRRLTHGRNLVDDGPTWSADGKQIAFYSGRRAGPGPGLGGPGQIRALAVVDVDGSHRHTILRVGAGAYLVGGPQWQRG